MRHPQPTVATSPPLIDTSSGWQTNGHPADLDGRLVEAWVAEMLANGAVPATAAARLATARQFSLLILIRCSRNCSARA
jgi:hypothetical protein